MRDRQGEVRSFGIVHVMARRMLLSSHQKRQPSSQDDAEIQQLVQVALYRMDQAPVKDGRNDSEGDARNDVILQVA